MSNFVQQNSSTTSQLNAVQAFGPTLAIAVGNNGTIVRWDGSTWTTIPSGTTKNLTGVYGASPALIYIVGLGGTMLQSLDGGLTWTDVSGRLNNIFSPPQSGDYTAIGGAGANVWVADTKYGRILGSGNGGSGWAEDQINFFAQWKSIAVAIDGPEKVYAVGVTGPTGSECRSVLAWTKGFGWGWTAAVQPTAAGMANAVWAVPTGPSGPEQAWVAFTPATGPSGSIVDYNGFEAAAPSVADIVWPNVASFMSIGGNAATAAIAAGVDTSGNPIVASMLTPIGSPTAATQWENIPLPVSTAGRGALLAAYGDASGYALAVGPNGLIVARSGTTLSMASALPVSTKSVRVSLTAIPLAQSVIGQGDALNPATWYVTRLDTGQRYTTIAVQQVDPQTFDVVIAERFGSTLVTHEVAADALVDVYGQSISAPTVLQFMGVVADTSNTPDAIAAAQRYVPTDIANPPFPKAGGLGGTRIITAAGDFQSSSGNELVKKLVIRRLTTTPGGFFHLPDYGAGLKVKEPVVASQLPALKKRLTAQILLEPDIEACDISVSLDSNGVLTVAGSVTTIYGATVPINVDATSGVNL